MNNIQNEQNKRFTSFQSNYKKGVWKYHMLLEAYWYQLTGAEQKILEFILRQTTARTTEVQGWGAVITKELTLLKNQ